VISDQPEAGKEAGKTDKMFRKGGSNPWKNAPKHLERRVRPLVKLTKCIGRTGQTFGRTDPKLWKNGSNSWKNWPKVVEKQVKFTVKFTQNCGKTG